LDQVGRVCSLKQLAEEERQPTQAGKALRHQVEDVVQTSSLIVDVLSPSIGPGHLHAD
jgi:hypothetical protein